MSSLKIQLGSRIGGRAENQDSCLSVETSLGTLVLVCDGMGGGPGGKFASSSAVNLIKEYVERQHDRTLADAGKILEEAIVGVNDALYRYSDEHPQFRGMGTTVAAVLVNADSAYVAHVGDSRVYQLRRGKKIFRTFDHSMVFERVRNDDNFTEEDARLSANSNVITRALGIRDQVKVDLARLSYESGDRFMLCTDGIWSAFPEKELLGFVTVPSSVSGAVDGLMVRVDKRGISEGGGHDNMTVAMFDMQSNSKYKEPMSRNVRMLLLCLSAALAVSVLLNVYLCIRQGSGKPEPKETGLDATEKVMEDTGAGKGIDKADESAGEGAAIVGKLDEIIGLLEELKLKGASSAKDREVEDLSAKVEDLSGELSELGIGVQEWNKVKEEIGKKRMKQDNSKVGKDAVLGHYNQVIVLVRDVKKKVEEKL